MKAHALIDGAAFGPETLKVVCQAFDDAWRDIEGNFGNDPRDIEMARVKLANAVLSMANEDSRNVEALKNGALQALALDYRRPTPGEHRRQDEPVADVVVALGFGHGGIGLREQVICLGLLGQDVLGLVKGVPAGRPCASRGAPFCHASKAGTNSARNRVRRKSASVASFCAAACDQARNVATSIWSWRDATVLWLEACARSAAEEAYLSAVP